MAKTKTKPRRWTAEEKAWLADRMREGKTYAEITAMCGRSFSSVESAGRKLGGYGEHLPEEEKARGGPRWSDEDRQLAELMMGLGFNHREVGSAVGRSRGTVACHLSRGRLVPADVQPLDRESPGGKWSRDEETLLSMLTERGWSDLRIGSLIGRSPAAVQLQRFRLGIESTRFASKQKAGGKWRPCMCCQTNFRSEGIHNRICDPCKSTEVYRLAS